MNYKITVFGLGFVGLTTALAFAEKGHKVYGFDVDIQRTEVIKNGSLPFAEPGLDSALVRHLNKNFVISNNAQLSVQESDFVFLCVGTPSGEKGEADLKYIYSAIDLFSSVLHDGKQRVIVIKSTIPPSTTKERIIPYLEEKELQPGVLFSIANNPEFLREGNCWDDMINADRIVCGISDHRGEEMLRSLYSGFSAPFFAVSLNTGEFVKYLSNTLLATMISYANEMSKIADTIEDIQVKEAFKILHLDRRWGNSNMASYVYPGAGYGGYCLPKDTRAMYALAQSKGFEANMLKNVISINETMPNFMANKIMRISDRKDKIGILGLSFKPGSDDVRDSSSAKIIKILLNSGYNHIFAFDPLANEVFQEEYSLDGITYYQDRQSICEASDVLVLVTAWDEFAGVDKDYPDKRLVDCRYYL
ncbi:UDPglucose 6-dehydrogenase [Paenibacillus sp. 1182]|uniref:UDP-glucose dehydrogenase family protein n=1 Tax=Paenibacillus sp. 1182 TaxID=2806565 RepID=UPI000FB1F7E6|nr:nucleotide sugar dehydrogenase [Paenibacillus sp. 1182]MBP1308060.1 UDPglucose 6-dehydrogenase [Paenibacillus sp. 1182]